MQRQQNEISKAILLLSTPDGSEGRGEEGEERDEPISLGLTNMVPLAWRGAIPNADASPWMDEIRQPLRELMISPLKGSYALKMWLSVP